MNIRTEAGLTLYFNALAFSSAAHKRQRRKNKDATPYINHPVQVSTILFNAGERDAILLASALLHDVTEDCGVSKAQLAKLFGAEVADLVEEVSDDKSLDKAVRKQLQIEHAATLSPRAKKLKLADKIANVIDVLREAPEGWSLDRRLDYTDHAHAVFNKIKGQNRKLDRQFSELYTRRHELIM